jgi:hypothetical protein
MLAVWSSDRSSLACQISRLTSVILGANEDNDSRSSLCLSHTLFFFSFSLFFVCLILSSLVYRTSWFRIYDSGLYGSVERNMLLYALDSLAFSSLHTRVPNEISNAALVDYKIFSFSSFFLFLLLEFFYIIFITNRVVISSCLWTMTASKKKKRLETW